MDRWKDRVALVTGASSGIGAALCRTLVKHGMVVVGCARNVDRIRNIADEEDVKNSTGSLTAIKCDLTNESEILSVFTDIREKFGRLDVCINNAGLAHDASLLSGKTEDWQNMLNVNVLALCICTREAVKMMREKSIDDGQIIHISSMSGHRVPATGATFYSGTKFMVRALTEGLRKELKALDTHIRISSISPGFVQTEFFARYMNDPSKEEPDFLQSLKPLQAEDIAHSAIYILSAPPHVEVHDILVRPTEQAT